MRTFVPLANSPSRRSDAPPLYIAAVSNNVTPAVGLYRHVGMRAVLAIDVWQARFPTT